VATRVATAARQGLAEAAGAAPPQQAVHIPRLSVRARHGATAGEISAAIRAALARGLTSR
jgi:hypothetical protein